MHRTQFDHRYREIGYHEDSEVHGTLELEFEAVHVFRFFNVPPKIHDELVHANSRKTITITNIGSRFRIRGVVGWRSHKRRTWRRT